MATIRKRILKNKEVSFQGIVRLKNAKPVTASFRRLTDAKKWVQGIEAAIRENRYFPNAEAKKRNLKELVERYKADTFSERKSKQTPGQTLDWWCTRLGHLPLIQINTALIKEHWDELSRANSQRTENKLKARTLNSYLETLSACFTRAVREYGWMNENPILKIQRKALPKGIVRCLSEEELKAFLAEVEKSTNPYLKLAVVLSLSTGGRKSEVMSLTWDNVNLKTGKVTFVDTKNGDTRSVPLNSSVLEALREYSKVRRLDTSLLFPARKPKWKNGDAKVSKEYEDLRGPFTKALTDANIKDFRWHDMRHTAASYLAMTGAGLTELKEILGHRCIAMTMRYAHLTNHHLNKVVERMHEQIFG